MRTTLKTIESMAVIALVSITLPIVLGGLILATAIGGDV